MEKDIAEIKRLLEEVVIYLKNDTSHDILLPAKNSETHPVELGKQLAKLCKQQKFPVAIDFLKKHENISLEEESDNGFMPLMYAVAYDFDLTELLVQRGANINHQDLNGNTALMIAIQSTSYGHIKRTIKLLLETGADYKIRNVEGKSAYEISNAEVKKLFREFLGL